jgi:3-oxoacyl-[acyl-carrier protein] reductase
MSNPNAQARRVLVTGASRGIGRAIALELAGSGFHVSLNYRASEDAAAEARAAIEDAGGVAQLLPFDISDRAACRAVLEADVAERGGFWGIVLNAGRTADSAFAMMSEEQWDGVLRTNLDGFYNVLKPLVMPMVRLRDGGRVVTITSVAGIGGNRGQANYAASKAGLAAATKTVALELARKRITANCVAPGFIETDMIDGLPREEVLPAIPMRRMGTPEEVAGLVGFLMSERSSYLTGQVISVNGGMI